MGPLPVQFVDGRFGSPGPFFCVSQMVLKQQHSELNEMPSGSLVTKVFLICRVTQLLQRCRSVSSDPWNRSTLATRRNCNWISNVFSCEIKCWFRWLLVQFCCGWWVRLLTCLSFSFVKEVLQATSRPGIGNQRHM